MRKIATFAALGLAATAIAGCSKPAEAPDAAASATAAAASAAPSAAPTSVPAGTYDVYDAAGKKLSTTTVNADGTYTDDDAKGVRTAGIVRITDGKTCFDPSGSAPPECTTDGAPGPDGSFTATDDKGVVVTVRPRAQ